MGFFNEIRFRKHRIAYTITFFLDPGLTSGLLLELVVILE